MHFFWYFAFLVAYNIYLLSALILVLVVVVVRAMVGVVDVDVDIDDVVVFALVLQNISALTRVPLRQAHEDDEHHDEAPEAEAVEAAEARLGAMFLEDGFG